MYTTGLQHDDGESAILLSNGNINFGNHFSHAKFNSHENNRVSFCHYITSNNLAQTKGKSSTKAQEQQPGTNTTNIYILESTGGYIVCFCS